MHIGIISKYSTEALKLCETTIDYLDGKSDITVEESIIDGLRSESEVKVLPLNKIEADVLVVIGGDGTVLRTIQRAKAIPILSVNMGRVGFLSAINPEALPEALDRVLNKEYKVSCRTKIQTLINGNRLYDSLNEVTLNTPHIAKILRFKLFIEGIEVEEFRANGIIVSTPTGSTCYALSAGGAVLDPGVNAFIIVPIAPINPGIHALVVPDSIEIGLQLMDKEGVLIIDGQYEKRVSTRDSVILKVAEGSAKFIDLGKDFYANLREKIV